MSTMPQWDRLTWDARRRAAEILETHIAALTARREIALGEAKAAIATLDDTKAQIHNARTELDDLRREAERMRRTIADLAEVAAVMGSLPPDAEGPARLREAAAATKRKRTAA